MELPNLDHVDRKALLLDLERADLEESLYLFYKAAWRFIDPAPWKDSWAIDAICQHLEAIVDGQIRRLIINCPPRIGKPVEKSALIPTLERGLLQLSEIFAGLHVLTHHGRFRKVIAVHRQGTLPVMQLTTRSGRRIVAAPDHPFLTTDGWRELGRIGPQDVVGTIPQYVRSGAKTCSTECARLLGYLIGDGACQGTPNVTVADDIEAADIHHCIEACGFKSVEQTYHIASNGHVLRRIALVSKNWTRRGQKAKGLRGPVRQFMTEHGLRGMNSYTKHVPEAVLQGDDEIVRNFIGAYWACDGFIMTRGTKRDGTQRDDLVIGCDSVNQTFMHEMQILLLRIGISSRIREKISKIQTKKQGSTYKSYSLTIYDQDNCWRFATLIKIVHSKGTKLENARKRRFDFDQIIRGEIVEEIADHGSAECICLTVDEDESFVANGFAVHNSSLTSVAFPAWTWAQSHRSHTCGPGVPFLYASYSDKLSLRDSVKCRRLVESPFYQERWGSRFKLTSDQNTKGRFTNDRSGERLITSIGAGVTGEGGNIIVIDDPNAANDLSETPIANVIDWWKGTMPTRPNDQELSAFVIIQQRLAENDLTGHILETEVDGWTHLMLPARYEPDRSYFTPIGWKDPRTTQNELLWPERLSEEALVRLERIMGPYTFAGQMQQRPEPAGGGIIKREWWRLWGAERFPAMDFTLACLDSAYTEDKINDPSGFAVWGIYSSMDDKLREEANRIITIDRHPKDRTRLVDRLLDVAPGDNRAMSKVMLMHAWDDHLQLSDLVKRVIASCVRWKVDLLLIENKASGISVSQEMRRLFANNKFGIQLMDPKSQDKYSRLHAVAPIFAEGLVSAPSEEYPWVEKVIKQAAQFPKGAHDEFVDLISMGIKYLRDTGLISRAVEFKADQEALKDYARLRELAPLYPV